MCQSFPKVFNKDYHVHNTFLENLKSGLQLDRPQTPHNEFEVMIKTFNECLLYLVIKLKLPTPVKTVFIKQAIDMVKYFVRYFISYVSALLHYRRS